MPQLTPEQVKKILEAPKKKAVIQAAVNHENRLKLHCEPAIERGEVSPALWDFEKWATIRKTPDKAAIFRSMERFPLATTKETKKAFDELYKVFDGQNPVYHCEFVNPDKGENWSDYREQKKFPDKWRTEGFEHLKLHINSMVVVDVPDSQEGGLPEPYFYFLDISNAIDWDDSKGMFHWVAFRIDDDLIAVIDDETYQVYRFPKNDLAKFEFVNASQHDLGYCPVNWFWNAKISKKNPSLKLSPITSHLGNLDYILKYSIEKDIVDEYAPWPVIAAYETDCDYRRDLPEGGFWQCHEGHLQDQGGQYIHTEDGTELKCPVCKDRRFNGPGTAVYVPAPSKNQDVQNMLEAVKFISPETENLEYIVEELKRRLTAFNKDVTGDGGEPNNDQAQNEKQIASAWEAKNRVLKDLKKNFEIIISWTDSTMCRLRYGSEMFISCHVDLGTEFYAYDEQSAVIQQMYQEAKAKKSPIDVLDFLDTQFWTTKFRNNPQQFMRQNILNNLDPLRHRDEGEAMILYEKRLISWEDYIIKLKFFTFVKRFEREQGSLLEFGSLLPFDSRIKKIRQIFEKYVNETSEPPQLDAEQLSVTGGKG